MERRPPGPGEMGLKRQFPFQQTMIPFSGLVTQTMLNTTQIKMIPASASDSAQQHVFEGVVRAEFEESACPAVSGFLLCPELLGVATYNAFLNEKGLTRDNVAIKSCTVTVTGTPPMLYVPLSNDVAFNQTPAAPDSRTMLGTLFTSTTLAQVRNWMRNTALLEELIEKAMVIRSVADLSESVSSGTRPTKTIVGWGYADDDSSAQSVSANVNDLVASLGCFHETGASRVFSPAEGVTFRAVSESDTAFVVSYTDGEAHVRTKAPAFLVLLRPELLDVEPASYVCPTTTLAVSFVLAPANAN